MEARAWIGRAAAPPQRRRPFALAPAVAVLASAGLVSGQYSTRAAEPAPPADLLLSGGPVLTVDPQDSVASALAVAGERIVYVGDATGAERWRGPETRVVDLGGRAVIPGLIDSHTHPAGASLTEFDHPIPTMEKVADVLDYVRGRAAELGEGEWIVLQQVFITRLEEKRYPARAELDAAAPRNPVIFRTGPDASLNTLALEHFKIDRTTEAPEGSKIERGAGGEPSGIIRGYGKLFSLPSTGRRPSAEERYSRLRELLRDYAASGLTAIADRNASGGARDLYRRLHAAGELPVRVVLSRAVGSFGSPDDIRARIRSVAAEPLAGEGGDSMLRTVGVKVFLDGGMLTGSAYLREPWGVSATYGISDPAYRGLRFIPEDKLVAAVDEAVAGGLQFTAHSVGDGAVHALLEAYAKVAETRGRDVLRATRPNITHCNFMSAEAVASMAKLGVSADIQPAWLYLDGRTLAGHFGRPRLQWFQPLRSCFDAGVVVGGGSDHMQKIGARRAVNPYDPFLGMWIATTRNARGLDAPLVPAQALTRARALRFYTANNAHLCFLEKEAGSLQPGKLADFVILDRNPLEGTAEQMRESRVLATYLAGREVFRR